MKSPHVNCSMQSTQKFEDCVKERLKVETIHNVSPSLTSVTLMKADKLVGMTTLRHGRLSSWKLTLRIELSRTSNKKPVKSWIVSVIECSEPQRKHKPVATYRPCISRKAALAQTYRFVTRVFASGLIYQDKNTLFCQ